MYLEFPNNLPQFYAQFRAPGLASGAAAATTKPCRKPNRASRGRIIIATLASITNSDNQIPNGEWRMAIWPRTPLRDMRYGMQKDKTYDDIE